MTLESAMSPFLTQEEAARLLRVSERTMERWRQEGTGPAFRRFGRRVVYARDDILAWSETCKASSTVVRNARR